MNLTNVIEQAQAAAEAPTNILIVDDIQQNLIAMEALLRRDNVNVLCASSGAQALELLLEHEVALALLDVHMPEMDGFSLAELMRGSQRTRDVPIIFLTASPDDPMRAFKGYESGAVDFLHKPVEPRVILGKVAIFIELYQQRRLLRLRNAHLERALKLNEVMIAVLTHDLRTPLSVILLCADKLALDLPDGIGADSLRHIENSAERMARMVEQLLDFSRIRSDGLRMQPDRVDVADLVGGVVEEVRQSNPAAALEFASEGDMDGHLDRDRIAQVVSNLVGNAVHHGGDAPVQVHLDGRDQEWLGLTVRNAGQIDDELLPRLFEPFKGSFKATKGLGLGLFIADQFVRAHGGSIVASNTDDGHVELRARLRRRIA